MAKIDFKNIIENDSEEEYYQKLHEKILEFIDQNEKVSFQKIVKTVGGSDRRILRLLNEMDNAGEINLENKEIHSSKNKVIPISYYDSICSQCDSKIVPLKGKFKEILKKMELFYSEKPTLTFIYDQRPVNAETTVRRAAYLLWRNDLIDKKMILLGDDDLTSIAIGLTNAAKEVVVLEIDERVVNFINNIAKRENLQVKAFKCDFTKNIPKNLERQFDVFLTDPSPDVGCFSLFVSLGIKLLKKDQGKVGYVSFFPSHQEISLDFQEIINNKGLIITDMIPNFTQYDFVEFTYKERDKKILKKFDNGEKKISFFENITRFVTTKKTFEELKKQKIKTIPLSKATKRIINNPKRDPAFMAGEKEFVIKKLKEIGERF